MGGSRYGPMARPCPTACSIRALFELNIEGICANSSQARGRVERTHLTLQDRLVKELRLCNIFKPMSGSGASRT